MVFWGPLFILGIFFFLMDSISLFVCFVNCGGDGFFQREGMSSSSGGYQA